MLLLEYLPIYAIQNLEVWSTDSRYAEKTHNSSIQAMEGCEAAYIEIYDATVSGDIVDEHPVIGPLCGIEPPVDFTTSSNIIIVHVHITAPPIGIYTPQNGSAIEADVSCGVNVTKSDCLRTERRPGPFVTFTADFTSYFIGKLYTEQAQYYIPPSHYTMRSTTVNPLYLASIIFSVFTP